MKTPANLARFVNNNKDKTFYHASMYDGYSKLVELSPRKPYVDFKHSIVWNSHDRKFDGVVLGFSHIFKTREEAQAVIDHYRSICDSFSRLPLISYDMAVAHGQQLLIAERTIASALSDHHGFNGVDFVETYRHSVFIRTFHKDVPGCSFGVQVEIQPDYSNFDEAVRFAIDQFRYNDNEQNIDFEQRRAADGEKYGWD